MSQENNSFPVDTCNQKTSRDSILNTFGIGCFVLILIGIVLLIPAVRAAREAARRMQCCSHNKGIALAFHNYHDQYKSLPPAYTTDEDGNPLHSWRVLILPYLEQQRLYEQIRLDEPWDSEYNKQFHNQMPQYLICPSARTGDKEKGLTSYMRIVGPETSTDGPNTIALKEVTAGTSNVIMLVEVIPTTCWMAPVDVQENDLAGDFKFSRKSGVGSMHTRGINISIMDGSVDFMPDSEAHELKNKVKIKQ